MGILSGSVTYKKFRVEGKPDRSFQQNLALSLKRHAFREIDPKVNAEQSIGWINPYNPLDANLTVERVLIGSYLILGMRRDRKMISNAILKARLSDAMRAAAREKKLKKLPREQIFAMRETIREQLLASVSPQTALYDMAWNYETGTVYLSTQSRNTCVEFSELFEESFELSLTEMNLVSRTEDALLRLGVDAELSSLEPVHFR